ncbi:MAG: hypothetical protein GY809_11990 [Planctomycetes bacterium]|nr:hypothetical protein [Planctomycetota bacterium]
MSRSARTSLGGRGTTLVELVVAVSIMAVVMSTVFSVLVPTRLTFQTQVSALDALQNGRILMDTLTRELNVARQITAVSTANDATGYIEFTDNDETTRRFDINGATDYVQHGPVGDLADLAGPVSQLQFTCYDPCDLNTPITDVNEIRLIKIKATLTNADELGQDKVFNTSVFIWRDGTTSDLKGWWCLDDEEGTTARDSSGGGYHGTLKNMAGDEWTTGVLDGALEFDGYNDYVDLPIGTLVAEATDCTVAAWVKWSGQGDSWQRVFDFGNSTTEYMYFTINGGDDDPMRFAITDGGYSDEERTEVSYPMASDWRHVAVTIDDANSTHTLYIDGEVVAQNTSATLNPSDLGETSNNWLGRGQYSSTNGFDGILDDVRFYNRALSAEEISGLISDAPWVLYREFSEAKTKAAQSLLIPTPGAESTSASDSVSFLGGLGYEDDFTEPQDFTIPAGSNRLLIFIAHMEYQDEDDDASLERVEYGGQPMTMIMEEMIEEQDHVAYVVAYMLDEAGIASASDTQFGNFDWSESPDNGGYYCFAVDNVNQDSPIGASESGEHDKDKTVWADDDLSTNEGDLVILAATAGNKGSYSLKEGFTEAVELDFESDTVVGVTGYYSADGDKVLCGAYHNNPRRQVIIGFVIQNGPVTYHPVTTIEGDLLIAAVATDSYETISEPSGEDWTLLSHGDGDGKVTLGVWAKLASASESGSHTFTWGSDEEAYGWIMRFEGHDPSNPLDEMASQDGGKTYYPPSPSVTTSVTNAMILKLGGFDKDKITVDDTGLSGYTTITMDKNDDGEGDASGGAAYQYQLEIGASGTGTFDLTDEEQYRTVTIAIAPEE